MRKFVTQGVIVSPWQPSRLTHGQQEEQRLAAQPVPHDPSCTAHDLARQFSVAEITIRAWRARLRGEGEEALRASCATGRSEWSTAAQQEGIGAILDGAVACSGEPGSASWGYFWSPRIRPRGRVASLQGCSKHLCHRPQELALPQEI